MKSECECALRRVLFHHSLLCLSCDLQKLVILFCLLFVFIFRYLTPDPTVLLSELSQSTSKKYNKLNSAIVTLVSSHHACF